MRGCRMTLSASSDRISNDTNFHHIRVVAITLDSQTEAFLPSRIHQNPPENSSKLDQSESSCLIRTLITPGFIMNKGLRGRTGPRAALIIMQEPREVEGNTWLQTRLMMCFPLELKLPFLVREFLHIADSRHLDRPFLR